MITARSDWFQQVMRALGQAECQKKGSLIDNDDSYVLVLTPNPPDDLLTCKDQFHNEKFKNQICSLLATNDIFNTCYPGWPLAKLLEATKLSADWICLPPFYTNKMIHIDRTSGDDTTLAHGLIYFFLDDDPNRSIWFVPWGQSHSGSLESILRPVPSGLGRGWMVVWTENSWHQARNDTNHPKYTLKFSLTTPKSMR